MARVFGSINLTVSVPVESEEESMGLLEVNFRCNVNRMIAYKLTAIDCKGKQHEFTVHDCDKLDLMEFIG